MLYISLSYIVNESCIIQQLKIINAGIFGVSLLLLFTLFRQNTANEKIIVAVASYIWLLAAMASAYILNKKLSIFW